MSEFGPEDRRAAQKRVDQAKNDLVKAVKSGDTKKVAAAKDRLNQAFKLRKRVNRPGPGKDAYRSGEGGGPQQGLGPPGPRG